MKYVIQHKTTAESYASSLSYDGLTQLLAVLKAGGEAIFPRNIHKSDLYRAVEAELDRRKSREIRSAEARLRASKKAREAAFKEAQEAWEHLSEVGGDPLKVWYT